ncbi:taste receptor type 1 member 3 [Clinocottus analis]|uniref:taste receptor type 1 member 3 n=1 Tax=Clinocottus analis TaxID=304258 RepID=UPI0035BF5365
MTNRIGNRMPAFFMSLNKPFLLSVICIMVGPLSLLVLCFAFRLSCTENLPEWFHNISTSLFNLPGDIMLGGLFPINQLSSNLSQRREPNSIRCESLDEFGLGLVLVMKYAVDEINANQILLPGIKLGYEIYDTCRQSGVIVKPTMSFLTAKSNKTLPVVCDYTNYETSISAVIGPLSSEMVSVIGKLLGFFLMPQISFGATSDKFSNKLLYPSFFRTVPSDKWQVDVMVRLLKEFNWTWVAVVGSEEEYGQQGVQEFSKTAENMSVCVAYQGLIPVYTDPESAINTIINNIIATKVEVVVVFSVQVQAEIFFKEVIKRNVTAVWIGSTSWAISTRLTTLPNIQKVGTIIGFTDQTQNLDLLTAYTQELFIKLSEEREKTTPRAQKSTGFGNSPCPQCWNLSPANISLVTSSSVTHTAFSVYAAIYSVAQALHNLLGCNSTACMQGPKTKILPWKLLEVLKNTSVDINGTHLTFDSDGNPNMGYDMIEWVWKASGLDFVAVGNFNGKLSINKNLFTWHTANSEVPQSTCSSKCAEGQVRRVKGFHSCCYDCIDCKAGTYQRNADDIQCTRCPDRTWSSDRSNNCTEPIFYVLSWDTAEALEITLAVVLLLLCQISAGVVFLKHRRTMLVTASGGVLSFVALFSLMGACLSVLVFLGQPGDVLCRFQLPLASIFQTVALSIFTSISLQILYATEFPKIAASHLHILRGPGSWLFVVVCCTLQAGLCGWFVQNGPLLSEYVANMKIDFKTAFLSCPMLPLSGFAVIQGFNGAMALISFMCTFMAAKPLHQYNLARDITFSSLFYCVTWVAFIPVYIGLNQKNKTIVHISFSLVGNLGLVAAYYFPKCHLLLRKPELNTAEHFCTFLEGASVTQVQEEPQPQTEERET